MFKKIPLGIKLVIFYFFCTTIFDFANFIPMASHGAAIGYYFYLPFMVLRLIAFIGLLKSKKWSIKSAITILCIDIFKAAIDYLQGIKNEAHIEMLSVYYFIWIALYIRMIFYLRKDSIKQYIDKN